MLSEAELSGASVADRTRAFGALLRSAWTEYEKDYARYFATAMVYYALVSLVPLVLLLLATLGLVLRLSDLAAEAAQSVLETVETSFGAPLTQTIEELLVRLAEGSVVATIISLGGLLVTASLLFGHLRITFRALWKQAPPLAAGSVTRAVLETFFEKAVAFAMVLAGGPLLLALLVLLAVLHWLGGLFSDVPFVGGAVGWVLALSTTLVFVPVTFGLLFKFLPPVRLPWSNVLLATALCSIAWLIGAEVLTLYVVRFGGSKSTYGALGGALIIMLWMKIMSQVLFFGAELCKVVSSSTSAAATNA
jgi:membrane protein